MTIRNIDDATKARLRLRAASHGKSMEDEARDILRTALATETAKELNLADAIQKRFAPFGGVDLGIPVRDTQHRAPVDFGE